ncbi:helix-turn-helix domain-containing protein [Cupriavidus basilensis]|uniref:helix-turn-helix domain-containing protein n=1 Tax=Cupriavidus basilensis TaxID=68895 RepID=UPI0039F6AC24
MSDALLVVRRDLGQGISSDVAESLTAKWKVRLVQPPNDDSDHSVADRMRNAARWLHENFERPISVADVARIASMSERHFLRCFKLQMGTLPSDYLFQVRLSMATRLLTETELPVDKIARRSGFSNGDRLAKIFRKRLSVSPIEFRNHSRC